MNQYIRKDKIINATEKAYNAIYKEQGFKPYSCESTVKQVQKVNHEKENKKENMKKDELLKIATEKGIIVPENATKEVIIDLINQVENKEEQKNKEKEEDN